MAFYYMPRSHRLYRGSYRRSVRPCRALAENVKVNELYEVKFGPFFLSKHTAQLLRIIEIYFLTHPIKLKGIFDFGWCTIYCTKHDKI